MLKPDEAAAIVEQLSLLKYFPSDPGARYALTRLLQRFCADYEKAQWLADRALDVFTEWPGTVDLRGLYCSRYKPCDGVEADCRATFPDGAPALPEGAADSLAIGAGREQRMIEAPRSTEPVSADPELVAMVDELAEKKRLRFAPAEIAADIQRLLAEDDPVARKLEQMGL